MKYLSNALAAAALATIMLMPWHAAGAVSSGMVGSGWTPVKTYAPPLWRPIAVRAPVPYYGMIPHRAWPQPQGWGYAARRFPIVRPGVMSVRPLPVGRVPLPLRVAPHGHFASAWQRPVPARFGRVPRARKAGGVATGAAYRLAAAGRAFTALPKARPPRGCRAFF